MIDNETMLRLERLAALTLTDAERAETAGQMNAVLSCLDVLHTCDALLTGDDPRVCPLRADLVRPSADRTALLAIAPETDGEHFLVPRAVE